MKRVLVIASAIATLIAASPVAAAASPRPAPSPCQSARLDYSAARRSEAQAEGVLRIRRERLIKMTNLVNRYMNKVTGAQLQLTRATAALATTTGYATDAQTKKDAAQAAYDAAVAANAAPAVITRTRLILRSAVYRLTYWQSQVAGKETIEATMEARLAAAEAELAAQEAVRDAAQVDLDAANAAYAAALQASAEARNSQIAAC